MGSPYLMSLRDCADTSKSVRLEKEKLFDVRQYRAQSPYHTRPEMEIASYGFPRFCSSGWLLLLMQLPEVLSCCSLWYLWRSGARHDV